MYAPDDNLFIISHMFHAPRNVVWETWTSEQHLQKYLVPRGFSFTPMRMDFKSNGEFFYRIITPNEHTLWGKWSFLEIIPMMKLVTVIAFTDERGNIIRHPMNKTWPLEILSVAEFRAQGDKTLVTVEWSPHLPSNNEVDTFESSRLSMTMNWRGVFDRLDTYLKQIVPAT